MDLSQDSQYVSPLISEEDEERNIDDPGTSTVPEAGPAKKKYRPSKKDIKDYPFNDEQIQAIADFVRDNTLLYDKRHPQWSVRNVKDDLWKQLAATFPTVAGSRCGNFSRSRGRPSEKSKKRKLEEVVPPPPSLEVLVTRISYGYGAF